MRQREFKPSTRVGYRNRPRTLPARVVIQEQLQKDDPYDYDIDWYCCDDCYYGPTPSFEIGDSVIFRIPGAGADVLKPGDGWATGEIIATTKNERGYTISYTVYTDQPITCYRRDTLELSPHKIQKVEALERLSRV